MPFMLICIALWLHREQGCGFGDALRGVLHEMARACSSEVDDCARTECRLLESKLEQDVDMGLQNSAVTFGLCCPCSALPARGEHYG